MEKKNIPELRFKGFEDEYIKLKFEDIAKVSQGLQIAIEKRYLKPDNTMLFYITNEFLKKESKIKYYIKDAPNNVIAEKDDILMTRTGNTGKVITDVHGAFHNNFFKIDYDRKSTNKYYLFYLLNSPSYQKIILSKAGSSTIPDLNHKDFLSMSLKLPCINEQIKVEKLLNNIDKKLKLEKEKHRKLKDLKKSMLKDMFPKEGESIPKLRFDGFDGEWKEFKINDLFSSIESGNRLPKEMLVEGDIPYVIATLSNNGIIDYIDIDTKDFHNNRMKLFKKNSITFSIDNPDAIFVQEQRFFASNIMRILHNDSYNLYHLKFIAESLIRLTRGFNWSFKFSGPVVMNASIKIPSKFSNSIDFDEIEKIGKVIYTLDNLSDNSKVLIKKIEDFKKSLMEKMFV